MINPQYPYLRDCFTCPNCGEAKPPGLILCWPCHHSQKAHNDGAYSKRLKAKLVAVETFLQQSKVGGK